MDMTAYEIESMGRALDQGKMVKCRGWLIVPHYTGLDRSFTAIQPDTGKVNSYRDSNHVTGEFESAASFTVVDKFSLDRGMAPAADTFSQKVDWGSSEQGRLVAFFDNQAPLITHRELRSQDEIERLTGSFIKSERKTASFAGWSIKTTIAALFEFQYFAVLHIRR